MQLTTRTATGAGRKELGRFLRVQEEVISEKDTPVYTCCYSGRRSGVAVNKLKKMGYRNVKNIGGIVSYKGEKEK